MRAGPGPKPRHPPPLRGEEGDRVGRRFHLTASKIVHPSCPSSARVGNRSGVFILSNENQGGARKCPQKQQLSWDVRVVEFKLKYGPPVVSAFARSDERYGGAPQVETASRGILGEPRGCFLRLKPRRALVLSPCCSIDWVRRRDKTAPGESVERGLVARMKPAGWQRHRDHQPGRRTGTETPAVAARAVVAHRNAER
jgi:hypothetical protein